MADHSWKIDGGTDEQFAWIESGEGHNIACVERVAGTNHDRSRVKFAGGSVTLMSEREIMQHATTDEQWQSIIDLIAAAPEMLACLREAKAELLDLYEAAYPDDESDNDTTRVIDRVIEVISKATGV